VGDIFILRTIKFGIQLLTIYYILLSAPVLIYRS